MVLDRYLIKEIATTFIGVAVVLLAIFISGQLVALYTQAAAGSLRVSVIFLSLGYDTISNLVFVLPLSLYLAILLSFSRLYHDNEIVVLSACGISQWRLLKPVAGLALIFFLLAGWLGIQLAPWANSKGEVLIKQTQQTADVEGLAPGRFKELPVGQGVVYVQKIDNDDSQLRNLFLRRQDNKDNTLITAESGHRREDDKTGERFLILNKGYRYEGNPRQENYTIIQFEQHGVRLEEQRPPNKVHLRQRAEPTLTLWRRGKNLDIAELQWRFSVPLLTAILAVMAVPLSRTSPRQGRYTRLAIALLIYIIYSNLLNVSRAWINKGEISPFVGMWWVHALALVIALMMMLRWRSLLRRLIGRR